MSANHVFHQIDAIDLEEGFVTRRVVRRTAHEKPLDQAYDLNNVGERGLHSPIVARKSFGAATLWSRVTGQAKREEKIAERLSRLN